MNNILSKIVIFAAGLGIGSVVTWKLLESKYEKRAQDEIEAFLAQEKEDSEAPDPDNVKRDEEVADSNTSVDKVSFLAGTKPDLNTYMNMVQEKGYTKEVADVEKPYVIPPEEFGEFSNYETISLTYYEDKILTDDQDNIIENIEDIVGTDSLTHFGEYEDDSVFVRNDRLRCDYEILLDLRKYSDVHPCLPDNDE